MATIHRVVIALIVSALGLITLSTPAAGQAATGTVSVKVVYCPQLEMAGELPGVPAEFCSPGPAQFSFYLVGDGTADYELLDVPLSGTASIDLPVGEHEVWEENTFVMMSVFVEANQTTSIVFGIPSEAGPETPGGELYISAWSCPGVTEVALTDAVGADCVRIATDLSFYLIGDGTNTYFHVPTMTTGAILAGLPLGDYEVVDEPTQAHLFLTVGNETGEVHIVYPQIVDPVTPTPAPTATKAAITTTPVTKLPSTGSGPEANIVALGAIVAGAVLTIGAVGLRLRNA